MYLPFRVLGCAALAWIEPAVAAIGSATGKHPLTLEEIVSLRVPLEPQISPDGKHVAYIVQQANLQDNENRMKLFLASVEAHGEPIELLESSTISQLQWNPKGTLISFVSDRSGSSQVWSVTSQGEKPQQVTDHAADVIEYAWSADGERLAFWSKASAQKDQERQLENDGIVYDDLKFNAWDVINNVWFSRPPQLWLFEPRDRKEEFLWQPSEQAFQAISSAGGLAWSPDETRLAVTFQGSSPKQGPFWSVRVGYFDLPTRKFSYLIRWNAVNEAPAWSPDGAVIAFRSTFADGGKRVKGALRGLSRVSVRGGETAELIPAGSFVRKHWWLSNRNILVEKSDFNVAGLYEIEATGGKLRKISHTNDHLHDCSVTRNARRAACVRENSFTPPEIAAVDLRTGSIKTLTSLNPNYHNIRLGEVSLVKWPNKLINDGQGYLVKPLDYEEGKRYPILVQTYGFNGGFVWQSQWTPNYSTQVFAARGYAVLLANPPALCADYPGYLYGDSAGARVASWLGTGTHESILNAVQMLVDAGIADPERVGIMGLSGGSEIADFMITHSNRFKAASSADGSSFYGTAAYVIGGMTMQRHIEEIGAQSPYAPGGSTLPNEMSASFNAHRTNTPVLMEYRDKNISGLEFYTALKSQGKPVELVFYPHDEHVLSRPRARLASMTRNLDWFDFWIKGQEDPAAYKAEQYERWRRLRAP